MYSKVYTGYHTSHVTSLACCVIKYFDIVALDVAFAYDWSKSV